MGKDIDLTSSKEHAIESLIRARYTTMLNILINNNVDLCGKMSVMTGRYSALSIENFDHAKSVLFNNGYNMEVEHCTLNYTVTLARV